MKTPLIVILIVYVALQALKYLLEWMNYRYVRGRENLVPPEFASVFDPAMLGKMRLYLLDKTRFDIVVSACASCAIAIFLFGGLLDPYNTWIEGMGLPFTVSGALFFLLLYLVSEALSIPFTLYFVFRIENRYGFNRMTYRIWLADFLKSTGLSIVLLSMVAIGGFWLVGWSPRAWWFWVWCFSLAFSVFVTYVSPYVIEPLFNKFTPVEDGGLKDRIVHLAARVGINVSKVLRMDASKRSTHTNAYFTGLGRTKRIILFDTLLKRLSEDEIVSVLAHEMGHWKKHHLLKGLTLSQLASLVLLFCAYRAMEGPFLSGLFDITRDSFFSKAVICAFFFSMVSFFLKPAMNGFSRMLEREADRFSCDLTGAGESMVRVLVKLSKDNLSNLFPHALYAFFNYSHPPVLERIGYIRAYCAKKGSIKK